MTNAMNSNMNKGMPGNAPVMAQGSPAMDPANVEFLNGSTIRPAGNAAAAAQGGNNSNSNHALQDYQMQLMLLEQQNKKRLLMARQEQDNMTNGPGGPAPPGQPGAFAPAMSPSGSRAGLSPNSSEQMKRGTPKMSQGVVPSPTPDGAMGQGRASPAPGFDPSQMNPNMPQNMFPQMNKIAMMGPNGQMIQPPSSHPMGGQMTQQQMEMFARANGGRMPNGFMPQPGPPGMMPGQQPGVPMQQPPNMTPHQRNAAMPPPPAPTADAGRGTQPSSPQQPPAPPTPSQGKNSNAKGKKDNKSNKVSHPLCRMYYILSITDNLLRRHLQRRALPPLLSWTQISLLRLLPHLQSHQRLPSLSHPRLVNLANNRTSHLSNRNLKIPCLSHSLTFPSEPAHSET